MWCLRQEKPTLDLTLRSQTLHATERREQAHAATGSIVGDADGTIRMFNMSY